MQETAATDQYGRGFQTLALGGGCHWCTEAVVQSLRGVSVVAQGFAASEPPHHDFSEAVHVTFATSVISLDDLVAVHLATHASTSAHKMRGKYRSAVYTTSSVQAISVRKAIEAIAGETGAEFVTAIVPLTDFKPSDARFHDYYRTDPTRPFCETYIVPKLAMIRTRFASLMA
ncbi:MAG: peptide-methionine (S)-S-oxide reductase [Pseudomonadota bacterium]